MTRSVLAVAVFATAVVAARLGAQVSPQNPVFRSAVEAVQLDVLVVDRDGRFVRDLKPEEIRIFEDGKEQTLSSFQLVEIPFEPSTAITLAGARVEPDVTSNADPSDGRLYVIVMDDRAGKSAGADQAYRLRSPTFRAIGREFVEKHVTDADRVAVVATSGRYELMQDFTNNRQRLVEVIDKFEAGYGPDDRGGGGAGGRFRDASYWAAPQFNPSRGPDTTRFALLSLKDIAVWLSQFEGRRKAIVLLSERMSVPGDFGLDDTYAASIQGRDLRDMVAEANRANVSLYILDPVGLPGAQTSSIKPVFVADNAEYEIDRKQGLEDLAAATGGFALTTSNEYTEAMDRIVTENSSYYLLGYTSSNPRDDGKFRKVRVEITRPGVVVRTRAGYVATKRTATKASPTRTDMPPALRDLIRSPLPVPGLGLHVSAVPTRGHGSSASVGFVIEVEGRELEFIERAGRRDGSIELLMTAADQSARVRLNERGAVTLRLNSDTREAAKERGARLLTRWDLSPGRYQVKVAAVDVTGQDKGKSKGTVLYDLVVPDFTAAGLSMSGIGIASAAASTVPTTGTDRQWSTVLGSLPTASRLFSADDTLRTFVEVYDNRKKPDHQLTVTTRIQRESGAPVFERTESLNQTTKTRVAAHRQVTPIALSSIGPGRFVLTVSAASDNEPNNVASRQVPFEVRAAE